MARGTRQFNERGERIDIHRPQMFDPSEYVIVGYADLKPVHVGVGIEAARPGFAEMIAKAEADRKAHVLNLFGTEWPSPNCGHCGHPGLRWVACAEHKPTGDRVVIGEICADTRLELSSQAEFRMKYLKTKAQRLDAQIKAEVEKNQARTAYAKAEPEVVTYLTNLPEGESFSFILDMADTLNRRGELTQGQTDAVKRCMAANAKRQERKEIEQSEMGEFPTGAATVEGEVVSLKWQTSDFGDQLKMLVKLDDGNKVWGTVPSNLIGHTLVAPTGGITIRGEFIEAGAQYHYGVEKGDRVRFTATFKVSNDDSHFGFYSRPRKAEIVVGA